MTTRGIEIEYTTNDGQQIYLLKRTLRKLDLSCRNITSINFSSLEKGSRLKEINLSGNNIENLNIEPLCSLKHLETLDIRNNPLKFVDITPLFFCNSLLDYQISPGGRGLVTPLALFARVNRCFINYWNSIGIAKKYDLLVKRMGWSETLRSIKSILKRMDKRDWFTAQRGFLSGLGMKEIAAYDGNPLNLLKGVTSSKPYAEAKNIIYDNAIMLLQKQLENCGSTHFLDVDELAVSRAMYLVTSVIQARRQEMKQLTIEVVNGKADARSIWFTFYGQRVMKELGYVPFPWNTIRLRDIVSGLKRVGFSPNIMEKERASKDQFWKRISEGLANHLEMIGAGHNLVQEGESSKPWFL